MQLFLFLFFFPFLQFLTKTQTKGAVFHVVRVMHRQQQNYVFPCVGDGRHWGHWGSCTLWNFKGLHFIDQGVSARHESQFVCLTEGFLGALLRVAPRVESFSCYFPTKVTQSCPPGVTRKQRRRLDRVPESFGITSAEPERGTGLSWMSVVSIKIVNTWWTQLAEASSELGRSPTGTTTSYFTVSCHWWKLQKYRYSEIKLLLFPLLAQNLWKRMENGRLLHYAQQSASSGATNSTTDYSVKIDLLTSLTTLFLK